MNINERLKMDLHVESNHMVMNLNLYVETQKDKYNDNPK